MRRLLLAVLLTFAPAVISAQTLTTNDIVSLTRAGLGEEVLIALIEVHRAVFPVDAETLKMLKSAGVSQKVIAAMVKSGRELPPVEPPVVPEPVIATPPVAPPPQVIVIEHEEPRVREAAVPSGYPVSYPFYGLTYGAAFLPVRTRSPRLDDHRRRVDPVYWGFGGKLRPDAWKPVETHHKPFIIPTTPQKK